MEYILTPVPIAYGYAPFNGAQGLRAAEMTRRAGAGVSTETMSRSYIFTQTPNSATGQAESRKE